MKRKNQRTLELIFHRPVSANVRWDDVEALFVELGAEIEPDRSGSRIAVVLFNEVRVSTALTQVRILTKVPLQQYGTGLNCTE